MKNSAKSADALRSLCKQLVKDYKPQPKVAMEPLDALVRAAMSYEVSDAKADEAIRAIGKEYGDLNELRVATDLEIHELLGVRYPDIERRVAMITQSLNFIFEHEHTLSLERLKTLSRRDARQFLRGLPDIHPFVEAYVMLRAFDAAAFPIDSEIVEYLEEEQILDEETRLEDAQKFVEHSIKADDLYDFFAAIRAAVFEDSKRRRKK